jgi:hypothetical protein
LRNFNSISISSIEASDFIILALFDIIWTFPFMYPLVLSIRSSDGELKEPPCFVPKTRGIPNIGQCVGTSKSLMDIEFFYC